MTPEGATYQQYIELTRDNILKELEGLPEEALNWQLGIPETNTLYVSAFHAAGTLAFSTIATVGQGTLERNRDAEFRSSGDLASLKERWRLTVEGSRGVLDKLSAADFNAPRVQIMGNTRRESTVREVLVNVLTHVNVHLGHIQLAKQLWEDYAKK